MIKGYMAKKDFELPYINHVIINIWEHNKIIGKGVKAVTVIPSEKVEEVVTFLDSLTRLDEKANLTQLKSFIKAIKADAVRSLAILGGRDE